MTQKKEESHSSTNSLPFDQNIAKGLIFIHDAIGSNIVNIQQVAAHIYALTETLISKGLISLHDLDQRKQIINQHMMTQMPEKWMGARMLADESDKYDAEREVVIDCHNRVHLCKAACCKLGFYLSRQDLEEGVVRWDFGRPYHIMQKENDYCVHYDEGTCKCTIREHRPLPCRTYDCRNDKRIWIDFDKMIPNPELV